MITRNGLMGPSLNKNTISAKLSDMGKFCLSGFGEHGQMIYIDADLNVYGCLVQLGPELSIGKISENGELHW